MLQCASCGDAFPSLQKGMCGECKNGTQSMQRIVTAQARDCQRNFLRDQIFPIDTNNSYEGCVIGGMHGKVRDDFGYCDICGHP